MHSLVAVAHIIQPVVFLLADMPARRYRVFIRLSKGYCPCDRLSSSRHRLLNLPDMHRTTHRWNRLGRNAGPTLIGQAKQKDTLYKLENQGLSTKTQVISDTYPVFQ